MLNEIDRAGFDSFLRTPFGQYLLEDIDDPDKVEAKGITKVSDFIKENNMFWKATRKVKQDACRVVNRASKENHPHHADRNRFRINLRSQRPRTGNGGRKDRTKEFANLKNTVNDTTLKLSQMTRLEMFEYYFTQLKDKTLLPDQM